MNISYKIKNKTVGKFLLASILSLTSSVSYGQLTNNQDIGNVGVAGSAFPNELGQELVQGSGADIWGTADAFHFSYAQVSGDVEIIARVANFFNENGSAIHPWAKAGVMVRETLAANSRNLAALVTGSNGVRYQERGAPGVNTLGFAGSGSAAPRWLRLVRQGNTVTGYESANGSNWTQLRITNIALSANIFVGLAVTSHNNSVIARGVFDNISITPLSSGNFVSLRKRNAINFAIDGGVGGSNGQNVYLWAFSSTNVNQQWQEISRGGGFFSYKKRNTNFVIDGGVGGAPNQNVYLWSEGPGNQNQHWRKVNAGGGFFRLEKRNASGFSIDGNIGGNNGQNVKLWNSQAGNQNQHWQIQ